MREKDEEMREREWLGMNGMNCKKIRLGGDFDFK